MDYCYCQSSVCGPIGWGYSDSAIVQISLDPDRPLQIHADISLGPITQYNQPHRSTGRILRYAGGEIIIVTPERREFYSGRGCLVVLDMPRGQRRFGVIETALFEAKNEQDWLARIKRVVEYPEEQQRLAITPEQMFRLKGLPPSYGYRSFTGQEPSTTRPTDFSELRGWTDEASFSTLYNAYEKAQQSEKQQALDALFAAVRDAGEERRRLADETISQVKRTLTPAQVKKLRFDPP
jgi:hypothetical protein